MLKQHRVLVRVVGPCVLQWKSEFENILSCEYFKMFKRLTQGGNPGYLQSPSPSLFTQISLLTRRSLTSDDVLLDICVAQRLSLDRIRFDRWRIWGKQSWLFLTSPTWHKWKSRTFTGKMGMVKFVALCNHGYLDNHRTTCWQLRNFTQPPKRM